MRSGKKVSNTAQISKMSENLEIVEWRSLGIFDNYSTMNLLNILSAFINRLFAHE